MKLKLFTQKPVVDEEEEKKVHFLKNIYSVLSTNTSISVGEKQKILMGALLHTGLAKNSLKLVASLKESPFDSLKTLGKTLYQWWEEVVRMWRFTKKNGITEGFHRKMKLIQRRAYGFRNFENYRLRVKVLCS